MTREEYEKQQSVVRRVFDPDTGRHRCVWRVQLCFNHLHTCMCVCVCVCRLVKGDGEIIEEIVSKDRHRAINKVDLWTVHQVLSFFFFCTLHSKPLWEMDSLFRVDLRNSCSS